MGRKKKEIIDTPTSSRKVTYKHVDVEAVEIPKTVQIVKEEVTYSFKNVSRVVVWYEDEQGRQKFINSGEVKSVNEYEANWLKSLDAYWKYGWIVENLENLPTGGFNPNVLSDMQFSKILEKQPDEKSKQYNERIQKYINSIESVFTLERLKNKMISEDRSASLVKHCEAKIAELQEEENKDKIAPIYRDKDTGVTTPFRKAKIKNIR